MFDILQATAEANNLAAVAAARETYSSLMEGVCGGAKPYLNSAHLEAEHQRIKEKALFQFVHKRKMGGESFSESYKEQLEKVSFYTNTSIIIFLFCGSKAFVMTASLV